jgi:hypothetical protein
MSNNHPQTINLTKKVKKGIETYRKIKRQIMSNEKIEKTKQISFAEYANYILKEGTDDQKKELIKVFGKKLYIHNKEVCSSPIS